jgi:ubiquinone/menaquinone biosynthesis C-methylase UbiE
MSASFDRRTNDHPRTYFVQDRKNKKEFTRLALQDEMITAAMGGILPEQPDPTALRRVLDVGCGTAGWLIEAARTYPIMSLVGIDISQRMIEYARAQAQACHVDHRIEFHVMDALQTLDFPTASFDLVNLRLSSSFVRTWDWPKILTELLRVTCPSEVVRVTDCQFFQSNSPALTQLNEMLVCALFRAGHQFTQEMTGLTSRLAQMLEQYGCEQVQIKAYAIEYPAGTVEGEVFYEDMKLFFQTIRPFIQKWSCAARDYEVIYQQALGEMHQPDFHATWSFLTAWGRKPQQKSRPTQQLSVQQSVPQPANGNF